MKRIILIFSLLFCLNSFANEPLIKAQNEKTWKWDNTTWKGYWATTYYVATPANGGNDANPGTFASPFATWEKLETVMIAGDNAYIRGGTYRNPFTTNEYKVWIDNIAGTVGAPCRIENYQNEVPILDFTDSLFSTPGVYGLYFQYCTYLTIKGLTVTGLAQHPSGNAVNVFSLDNCDNCVVERCVTSYSGGSGFVLLHSDNNLLLNNDSHHLGDEFTGWGGTNGVAITSNVNSSTGNTIRGHRSWAVSDNGYAFFALDGTVTLDSCWAFRIGWRNGGTTLGGDGVGFKMGPGAIDDISTFRRTVQNCVAVENSYIGFDENRNAGASYKSRLYNNLAWQNGTNNTVGGYTYIEGYNYAYYDNTAPEPPHVLTNNIAFVGNNLFLGTSNIFTTNSWQVGTVTTGDFITLNSAGMDGPRQANGSLPNLDFGKLASDSDLKDIGTNVGLSFYNLPPLGPYDWYPASSSNYRILFKVN